MEKKKYCPRCGTELDEDDAICVNCGAHQTKTIEAPKEKEENAKIRCRRCGALFSPDNKTCPICGASNKDRIVSSEPVRSAHMTAPSAGNKDRIVSSEPVPTKKTNSNTIKDTAPEDAVTVSAVLGILSIIFSPTILFGLIFGGLGASRSNRDSDRILSHVGIVISLLLAVIGLIVLLVVLH